MIKIIIHRLNGKIKNLEVKGHAKYGKPGEDMICAVVSTSVQQAIVGLQDYLGIKLKLVVKDGLIRLDVDEELIKGKESEVNALLESMYMVLCQAHEDYKGFINLQVREGK